MLNLNWDWNWEQEVEEISRVGLENENRESDRIVEEIWENVIPEIGHPVAAMRIANHLDMQYCFIVAGKLRRKCLNSVPRDDRGRMADEHFDEIYTRLTCSKLED